MDNKEIRALIRSTVESLFEKITPQTQKSSTAQQHLFSISYDQKPIDDSTESEEVRKKKEDEKARLVKELVEDFIKNNGCLFHSKPVRTTLLFISQYNYNEITNRISKSKLPSQAYFVLMELYEDILLSEYINTDFDKDFYDKNKNFSIPR